MRDRGDKTMKKETTIDLGKNLTPCKNLEQVRQCIDDIDDRLLDLLSERSAYVRQVIRFKNRDQIVDLPRIEQIIAAMRKGALQRDLDPDMVEGIWRMMIDRFIALEEKIFEEG